ncbi:MAG: hypothetical protein V3S51_02620 [Dehalococcoidia bacterium]
MLSSPLNRWGILIALVGLGLYAFLVRILQLSVLDHHYLISPDSYYFHWLADRVMAGEGPPSPPGVADIYTLHSGLAYPLAYIAKAIASVSGISSAEALELASKYLPPFLGIISMVVIYVVAARIYNYRVALLSSFAWAASGHAILHGGAAGHIDRDVLSMLLLMIGAFIFYFSRDWQFRVGNRDIGWLLAGLSVLAIEALLYLEWEPVGPSLLLAILVAYAVVRFILEYANPVLPKTEQHGTRRLAAAIGTVNWRTLTFIIGVNAVVVAALYSRFSGWFTTATNIFGTGGGGNIDELQGVWARGFLDFTSYHFLLIPIAIGLYLAWKRRDEGGIFFSCWFLCLVVLSMFSARVLVWAAPATSLLAGLGLSFLWDLGGWSPSKLLLKRALVVGLICLMIISSFMMVLFIVTTPNMTMYEDWQDALTYLRDHSADDAVVMSWWDSGYWILDVAQRRPVVDNGYYGWGESQLSDIRTAYLTTEPSEAAQIMNKYGAEYLVFSDTHSAPIIMTWPGRPRQIDGKNPSFPKDSLVARSLAGDFESEGGLELWYRSDEYRVDPDSTVVILRLRHDQSTQP